LTDLARQSFAVLVTAERTVVVEVLVNSTYDLGQVTVTDIRRMVEVAEEHSMTQQVAASFVMVDLSIGQHEQEKVHWQLSVTSGDMLLAAVLQ